MNLPNDVARCAGYSVDGEWREGCADCLRRTSPATGARVPHIQPPAIIAFECEFRIETNDGVKGAPRSGVGP